MALTVKKSIGPYVCQVTIGPNKLWIFSHSAKHMRQFTVSPKQYILNAHSMRICKSKRMSKKPQSN